MPNRIVDWVRSGVQACMSCINPQNEECPPQAKRKKGRRMAKRKCKVGPEPQQEKRKLVAKETHEQKGPKKSQEDSSICYARIISDLAAQYVGLGIGEKASIGAGGIKVPSESHVISLPLSPLVGENPKDFQIIRHKPPVAPKRKPRAPSPVMPPFKEWVKQWKK